MATIHDTIEASQHGMFLSSPHGFRGTASSLPSNVWRFDGSTGSLIGSWRIGSVLTSLDVHGSHVYVAGAVSAAKNLWCLDLSGNEQWSFLTNNSNNAVASIRARSGLVASCDALGTTKLSDSGSLIWRNQYGSSIVELGTSGVVWTNYGGVSKFASPSGVRTWTRNLYGGGYYGATGIASGSDDSIAVAASSALYLGIGLLNSAGTPDGTVGNPNTAGYWSVYPFGPGGSGILSHWLRSTDDDDLEQTRVQTGVVGGAPYTTLSTMFDLGSPAGAGTKMFNAVQDMFLFDGRSHIDPVRFGFAASNAVAAVDSVYVPVYGNSESLSWGKWQRPSTNADAYNTALWDAPSPVGSKVATPKALRLDGDGNVWMI